MTSNEERHNPARMFLRPWLIGMALPLMMIAVQLPGSAPASAANVVNVTIQIPASVETNPCFPEDVIALSGDMHIVITTTAAEGDAYRVVNQFNSQLSGVSLTTGTTYVNSDTKYQRWSAKAPFPVQYSTVQDFELISQSSAYNYIMHMAMTEIIDANGIPTITSYNFWMDCKG